MMFCLRKAWAPVACLVTGIAVAGPDRESTFNNANGIINTRHNMTQSTMGTGQAGQMNSSRNDYGQVCVYCHTPHGANTSVAAPLWNRTTRQTTYTTYDLLGTGSLTQPVTQPGANSLTCLSCHDGQTAIDSVVNMPGSGGWDPNQMIDSTNEFLNSWPGTAARDSHLGMTETGCLVCHQPGGFGELFPNAPDFKAFAIRTDLTDDHPVGIRFPVGNSDFNQPEAWQNNALYFDRDGNQRMSSDEIRLYSTGEGPEVECASCHDPHGVPSNGSGSNFIKSFLRVDNDTGSAVCMTCHNK